MNLTLDHINQALVKATLKRDDLWNREIASMVDGYRDLPPQNDVLIAEAEVKILSNLINIMKKD